MKKDFFLNLNIVGELECGTIYNARLLDWDCNTPDDVLAAIDELYKELCSLVLRRVNYYE